MIHQFPYSNLHDQNYDWIIRAVGEFKEKYEDFDSAVNAAIARIEAQGDTEAHSLETLTETLKGVVEAAETLALSNIESQKNDSIAAVQNAQNTASTAITEQTSLAISNYLSMANIYENRLSTLIAELPADDASLLAKVLLLSKVVSGNVTQSMTWFFTAYEDGKIPSQTGIQSANEISSYAIRGAAGMQITISFLTGYQTDKYIKGVKWYTGYDDDAHKYTGLTGVSFQGNQRSVRWAVPDLCYAFSFVLGTTNTDFHSTQPNVSAFWYTPDELRFEDLEDRVDDLEDRVDELEADVDELKSALTDYIGENVQIPLGTPQNGYYTGNTNTTITYNASDGSHAYHFDLSDYIGMQVNVKFVTTPSTSGRRTAMCNDEGLIISTSYEEKNMTADGWTLDITQEAHDLYTSIDTTRSSELTITVISESVMDEWKDNVDTDISTIKATIGNTPMGTTANTITGAIAELKDEIETSGIVEYPVIPSWFPSLPYPVYKNNGKWTFNDIDPTQISSTYEWKTYYIDSASGNDENNGTENAPLKTLKAGITKYLSAGYPTRLIVTDGSIFYMPDTYGSAFNVKKSLIIESAGTATIACGYSPTSVGFTQSGTIYSSTEDISGYSIIACVDIGGAVLDDYGMHKPMTLVNSAEAVAETEGSYYIGSGVIYVNPYTSIDNIVCLTSANTGFAPTSTSPLDETTAILLKNIRFIGNTVFARSAHDKKVMLLLNNCILENNPANNGLTFSGYDVAYIKDSVAGYVKSDGFNVADGNMSAAQTAASVVVYANCKAKECGWYDTNASHNCNLNTAHKATNVLRCGFVGYNADGPMIADVNGCYTVNYDVTVFNNSYNYTVTNKGAFEFNSVDASRTTKQKCVNCYAYDKRSGYKNLVTDGEIWICGGNLMDNVSGGTLYPAEN